MRTDGMTLASLAQSIGAEIAGPQASREALISRCNTLESAGPGDVSFVSNAKYGRYLETSLATAVIVASNVTTHRTDLTLLKTKDPYYAWMRAMVVLHGHRKHPHDGIHPQAVVDPTASVGEGSILYPGVYVGPRAKIGQDCILYPNVTVYDDCIVGNRVILHSGACIGPDGFGYASHKDLDGVWRHHKIPQIGHVVIEDDVEIGSNTSIARAAVDITRIGQGTKIDNNVAIGHGVQVGPHCLLVAQVGIAGSTIVGHHVTMAGQVGVAGHLKIGDGATIAAQTGVMSDVGPGSTMIGHPAMPATQARRVYVHFTQLPDLVDRIKQLEKQVKALTPQA